ncbi:hypothetical protein KSS87_010257 [Heliosperma pusillum]|nr:hypothetical protein KSS87_010257 [Heliosperma pusillum]
MEINLKAIPFDIDFHPSDSLVATGLINGYLLLYRYAADAEPQRLLKIRAHKKSCRAARFISNGRAIVTGSPDCSILATDVETGAKVAHLENAHSAPINRIINLTEATIASGDDAGCVKVWDTRQQSCCNTFQVHEEYISDITFAPDSMKLLATSGDGTLSVLSVRNNKVHAQSEFCEDEPLSVVIMKNGRKVICGTQTGTLLLYSWGFFSDCSSLCSLPEESSFDSLLHVLSDRFVDLRPNPVDALLKLWDMDELLQGSSSVMRRNDAAPDSDSDSDGMDVDSRAPASRGTKTKNVGNGKGQASSSFFAEL